MNWVSGTWNTYFYQLLVDWALLSVDVLIKDQRCLKISWRRYISIKCLKNFKWEDIEQTCLFSIFFLGDGCVLLPKNILEIYVQCLNYLPVRFSVRLTCLYITNMYYTRVYKYIFMIIMYITPLWQGTPRAFCVRSPQWVGAAGGRGYAPARLRVPQKCGSQYN